MTVKWTLRAHWHTNAQKIITKFIGIAFGAFPKHLKVKENLDTRLHKIVWYNMMRRKIKIEDNVFVEMVGDGGPSQSPKKVGSEEKKCWIEDSFL